jgi:SAM-dependent methyltransferase
MTTEEIVKKLEPWLAKHRRPAWKPVVQGGDGPATAPKFCGTPWIGPDAPWPACGHCNKPLPPFLQLDLGDLPAELGQPFGAGLLQLFYCRLLTDTARIGPEDNVLDVACGPGLVACPLAEVARHVTGIGLTPAMIEQGRARQLTKGLTSLTWLVGDAVPLPFPDAAFSVVVSRYSFHHFLDPKAVLAEMVRVCRPGGRVAVIDVFTGNPKQAEAYNRVEKLRDPSHVRALPLEELTGLCHHAGLRDVRTSFYKLNVPLEELLARSFPNPGNAGRIRQTFAGDVGVDRLGVGAHRRGGAIHFAFRMVVILGQTQAAWASSCGEWNASPCPSVKQTGRPLDDCPRPRPRRAAGHERHLHVRGGPLRPRRGLCRHLPERRWQGT